MAAVAVDVAMESTSQEILNLLKTVKTLVTDDSKFDWNIGKHCRYGNAWIRKPDGDVSFITCEPEYVYSVLLILRYGYRNFGSVCPVLGKRG